MNMKKWSTMGLAASMVLVAAGCGKSTPVETTKPAASAAPTTAATAAPTAAGPKKLTGDFEIQYFVGGYGDKWWKKVIAEFQAANPDLKIKESAGPKINEQMKPRWIAGTPPDFVYIDGPEFSIAKWLQTDNLKI